MRRQRCSTGSSDRHRCGLQDGSLKKPSWQQRYPSSSVDHQLQGPCSSLGCDSDEWQAARRSGEDLPL